MYKVFPATITRRNNVTLRKVSKVYIHVYITSAEPDVGGKYKVGSAFAERNITRNPPPPTTPFLVLLPIGAKDG